MLKSKKKQIIAFFFVLISIFSLHAIIIQTCISSNNSFIDSEFKYDAKKINETENLLNDSGVVAVDLDFESYTGVFNYDLNVDLSHNKNSYINLKNLNSDSDSTEIIVTKKGIIKNYDKIIYKKTISKDQNEIILDILNSGSYQVKVLNLVDKESINIKGNLLLHNYNK